MKYFYLSWYVYNEFLFIVCPTIVTKLLIATFRPLTAGLHQRWCRFTMSTTTVASDEPQLMVGRFRSEALYKTISSAGSAVITIGCYVVWSLIALGFISFRQQGWPGQLLPPYFPSTEKWVIWLVGRSQYPPISQLHPFSTELRKDKNGCKWYFHPPLIVHRRKHATRYSKWLVYKTVLNGLACIRETSEEARKAAKTFF